MKSLLYGLQKLNEEDIAPLSFLFQLAEGEYKEYINYAIDVYNETGAFPSYSILNEKFGLTLSVEDVVKNVPKHLNMLLNDHQDKATRKALLKLSSSDKLTPALVDSEISKCRFDVCVLKEAEEFNIKTIYGDIKSRPVGCKFFIEGLDEEVVGVSYGKVCTIMGWVSQFKTTLALSLIYGNAKEFGYNFVLISLEGQKEELYINLLSRHSYALRPENPLTAKDIKKGLLSEQDEAFLAEVEVDYKKLKGKIFILDGYDISEGNEVSVRSITRALDICNEKAKLDAVAVDYIQLFKFFKMAGARTNDERMNAAVEFFTNTAIHYNKPQGLIVFILSQTNRTGWMKAVRQRGKYTLTALSEINSLERASYYAVSVFTDDILVASQEVQIQLLKHKGGEKIEEPFSTYVNPAYGLIGDVEGYGKVFSEESLEEVFDVFEDF